MKTKKTILKKMKEMVGKVSKLSKQRSAKPSKPSKLPKPSKPSKLSKPGFTLIELMVASILLGMLVVVLTMIFNQSSIAWRTGVATVASLGDTQRALGTYQEISDEILPGLGDEKVSGGSGDNRNLNNRTVSLWDGDTLRSGRAYESVSGWGNAPQQTIASAMTGRAQSIGGAGNGQSAGLFIVGVMSAGPDRKFGTEDDITTWPEDVE